MHMTTYKLDYIYCKKNQVALVPPSNASNGNRFNAARLTLRFVLDLATDGDYRGLTRTFSLEHVYQLVPYYMPVGNELKWEKFRPPLICSNFIGFL